MFVSTDHGVDDVTVGQVILTKSVNLCALLTILSADASASG